MTETFDREAIQRGYDLAFAAGCFPSLTDDIAAFLAHYAAMAEGLEHATDLLVETWGNIMPGEPQKEIAVINARAVLSAYASQKETGE